MRVLIDTFPGWAFLNENAWIASALLVLAFFGAAVTLAWHINETNSHFYNLLAVAVLLVMAVSFLLTGVSVGESPLIPGRRLIPSIRLLWLLAGLLFNTYLIIYWSKRLVWKRDNSRR